MLGLVAAVGFAGKALLGEFSWIAAEVADGPTTALSVDDLGICPPATPILSVFVVGVVSPVVVAMDRELEELDSDVEFAPPPALPADGDGVAIACFPWRLPPTAPPTMAPMAATTNTAKMIIHFVVRHHGVGRWSGYVSNASLDAIAASAWLVLGRARVACSSGGVTTLPSFSSRSTLYPACNVQSAHDLDHRSLALTYFSSRVRAGASARRRSS